MCMPSRQTAEPGLDTEERAEFMHQVSEFGVVEGYNGVRISADGTRRFKIKDAVVRNVHNDANELIGQAATFFGYVQFNVSFAQFDVVYMCILSS